MAGEEIACFFKLILQPRLDLQKLEIPRKFVSVYGKNLWKVIYVHDPSGKIWEFELVRANDKYLLQKGWPEFVEYYSLSHGDCIMFKFKGNHRFDVVIFNITASEIEYPQPNRDIKRDSACPSFATKMEPTFLNHEFTGVIIPSEFAKTYLDKSPCTLKLRTDKTWEVSFTGGGSRHAKLSTGWEVFASDNKLEVGDICMFELFGCQELKVCIIRESSRDPRKIIKPSKVRAKACARSTQPEDIDSWPKQPRAGRPPTRDPRDVAVMAAEAYRSAFAGNPSFSIAITSGYMKHNILNIPLRWVETYMRGSDKRTITLKGGKKSLNTKLIIYRHITGSHCKLTGGISNFFHDNAIIQGDVCVFELVNNVPNTLKVLVFR